MAGQHNARQRNSKYDGYHTALAPEPFRLDPLDHAGFSDGAALRYDLFDRGPPKEFAQCDVLYSELPWRKGFDEFERRAGISGRDYNDFLEAVRWHILAIGAPTVIITGIHAKKRLDPDRVFPAVLNGEMMLAMCWGVQHLAGDKTENILSGLAAKYSRLGDFCCGYGRTAEFARGAGKRFVVSDYNGSCIRYIADKMADPAWGVAV